MDSTRFWWRHARLPLIAFALLAPLFAFSTLDVDIAKVLFFDAERTRWLGAHTWWANDLLHSGGRWAVRIVAAGALAVWLLATRYSRWRDWQRASGYLLLALVLSTGLVGLLKVLTNVDCPWDLNVFGGTRPYLHLFAHRAADLPQARCFPAAHASSGYALMALYFMAMERSRRFARMGLALGLATGLLFGFAQEARGAHFVSHDLWSAVLVWLTCLSLYVYGFRQRLHDADLAMTCAPTRDGTMPGDGPPAGFY